MSIATLTTSQAMQELRAAVSRLSHGVRDPDIARKACERMDLMREELRERIGNVDLAVELVRDA